MSQNQHMAGNVPCSVLIQSIYPSLRNSEQMVADFVLSAPQEVLQLTMLNLSRQIGVSEASVIRFCKRIGYSGYSEFKLMLAKEVGQRGSEGFECDDGIEIYSDSELEEIPQKVISRSIRALEDTLQIFNQREYERAVHVLSSARRVVLFGVGNSASVAEDAATKFLRLGIQCSVADDAHVQMMTAIHLRPGDVAIGISHSGRTKDTVDALKLARESGATTICITNHQASYITEAADIHLLTAATETSFDSETMASRIAQLAIIDMLYIGILLQDFSGFRQKISKMDSMMSDKAY